jgi:hypothetical protein
MDTDAAAAQAEISQLRETIEEYKRECATAKNDMATLKVSRYANVMVIGMIIVSDTFCFISKNMTRIRPSCKKSMKNSKSSIRRLSV